MRKSGLFLCRPEIKRIFRLTLIFTIFISVPFFGKSKTIALTERDNGTKNSFKEDYLPGENALVRKMITTAAIKHGVDPDLVRLVVSQESGFKTRARSQKHAQGLMQLIPETAARFGILNPYDPQQNIDGGTQYLKWLLNRFDGDVRLALAGYNAGENTVKRYGNKVPPFKETRRYVKKITAAYGKTYHTVPFRSNSSSTLSIPPIK